MTPTEVVLAAVAAMFLNFDSAQAERLLKADYIQHNPGVPTGAAPILGAIPALKQSGLRVTTHRLIAEGDLVVMHNTYENAQMFGGPTLVGFDVFRVEDGRVAEHWDNLQPKRGPNPSGRSMTDGATDPGDVAATAKSKALVEAFARTVLVGGATAHAAEFISPTRYRQHNPDIADGLEGLAQAFTALEAAGHGIRYVEVHKIVAQGEMVFTMAEGLMGQTPTAFFDLFRVEDGQIVEHWDVIAEIPATMAHENGKF